MDSSPSSSISSTKCFRDVIRHFTPAWFAVNMGTGVLAALLHSFPYGGSTRALNFLALAFLFLNLVLFLLFLALSITRYVLFPPIWGVLLRHPVQSLYIGCFPMGAVTIINAGVTVVYGYWRWGGAPFLYVLWGFWWLDTVISFICCFGLVYIMETRHRNSMSTLTPLWLLPVVTLIVASSTGQLLAAALLPHSLSHALITLGTSIVMVAIGITLATMILTLYFRRLLIEGIPDIGSIISSFIPLGPCGQAGYSLLLAGENLKKFLPISERSSSSVLTNPVSGEVLNILCFAVAFVLWCLGTWWLVSAIIHIFDTLARRKTIPFKLAFWGLVFPNGVQALLTVQLGTALDARFFRTLGAVYSAGVILIWLALVVPTLLQVCDRSIFCAPCLENELMQPLNEKSENLPL